MQYVVARSPAEMAFGKEMQKARGGLIKIDQAERYIESANQNLLFAKGGNQTDRAENDMKNIVFRRTAENRFRQYETENARQDQNRRKDQERVIIYVFHSFFPGLK